MPTYNTMVGDKTEITHSSDFDAGDVVIFSHLNNVITWRQTGSDTFEVFSVSPGSGQILVEGTSYDFNVAQDRSSQIIDRTRVQISDQRVFGDGDRITLNKSLFGENSNPNAAPFTVTSFTNVFRIQAVNIASYIGVNASWNQITWGSYSFRMGKRTSRTETDEFGKLTLEGLTLTPGVNVHLNLNNIYSELRGDTYFQRAYSADRFDFTIDLTRQQDSETALLDVELRTTMLRITPRDIGIWNLEITLTDNEDEGIAPIIADLPLYVQTLYGENPVDNKNTRNVIRQNRVPPIDIVENLYTGTIEDPPENIVIQMVLSDIEVSGVSAKVKAIDRRVLSSTIERELGTQGRPLFSYAKQFVRNDYTAIWPRDEGRPSRDLEPGEE